MSNAKESFSILEIMELVELLRENGDKVLSASSKLSLSTTLLYNLNEAFALIVDEPGDLESSFHVCNSSKIDVFRDLKFLHDFVQKTVGLKLISCPGEARLPVDITKFRHLKYLELKKVCVELVRGLQGFRAQLESVICAGRRGVTSVHQLLASCGGDASIGFVWDSLKHLALPHNTLEKLDASLALAPWLQILDLSHNLLTSADELYALPNLKYVNLGYNKLATAPIFNKAASHSLQLLVLKNNYIDNINGLQDLHSLTELDLSFNCITDHSVLWPLEKMSALSWMSLEGNPLSYHPKHRPLSLKYLHPSLSDSKFVLDHLPLSRSEKHLIAENRAFAIRADQSTSKEYLSSLNSVGSSSLFVSANAGLGSEAARRQSAELTESFESSCSRSRRKLNVREAVITEDEQERGEESDGSSLLSSSYLETSKDHLETKKRILELRKRFGEDNWLSNQAGSFVQDIMGLPASQPTLVSVLNTETTSETGSACQGVQTAVVDDSGVKISENDSGVKIRENDTAERIETVEGDVENIDKDEEETRVVNAEGSNESANAAIAAEPAYDPEEETGDLYLVQKKRTTDELEELFLIISSDDIKERDAITGKIKYSWSTNSVLSCVLGRSDPVTVDIIFDTTREDRQNRRYFAEPDDAKKIVATIGEGMRKRPIQLKVYKCMKCSTHFSQDSEYMSAIAVSVSSARQLKCPTCNSTLVIQTDDLTTFDGESESAEAQPVKERSPEPRINLQHSDSYSSIGGTEGRAMSVTTSLVHSDSHTQAQVCSSATSLEESWESTPAANASNTKYESDIEVLSNPSQSSIEVLDEASKNQHTPHRKRSSEERRLAAAPSLLTVPDTPPVVTGLTESSSSGSLTDSICTAYENRAAKQNAEEKSQCGSGEKRTNLTSMLGGLLQSIKIGSNKPLLLKPEERSQFLGSSIQYSYTDFGSVDHRVKLHIILNVFELEKEELVLLLRADILLPTVKDTFPGCLVLSTSKVYVLRIDGPEGEDPQRWLHKEASWTMDRLRSFAPLPFKQGVVIELHQPNKPTESHLLLLCILQDFQRTSNFLFYITDLQLPPSCEVEFSVPEHCTKLMHDLLKTSKSYHEEDSVRLLALVSSAALRDQDTTVELRLSSLIVTGSALVMLEDNMQWLLPGSNEAPRIAREQAMSNLIAIEHTDTSLTLNFMDEVAAAEGSWTLNFVSTSAAEAVINSVQPPWEELFSIPLQITTGKVQGAAGDDI